MFDLVLENELDRKRVSNKGAIMQRKIKTITLGPVNTNCYVLINEDTMEGVIIDPAHPTDCFIQSFEVEKIKPVAILLTHGHFDHIGGVEALVEKYKLPVYAMEAEEELLKSGELNLSSRMGPLVTLNHVNGLKDMQVINLAGFEIKSIHTPGHTAGGGCYYIEKESIIFTGDTLFAGCIGRTDFPTGSRSCLVSSIKEKLFVLPEDTLVYPGHMDATSICHEKQHNPMV